MLTRQGTTLTLRDGRHLAYTEWGVADWQPVVYLPGMPGSRTWVP
jgi:hypothetical protein